MLGSQRLQGPTPKLFLCVSPCALASMQFEKGTAKPRPFALKSKLKKITPAFIMKLYVSDSTLIK